MKGQMDGAVKVMANCKKCKKQRAHVEGKCTKCGTVNAKLTQAAAARVVQAASEAVGGAVTAHVTSPAPTESKPKEPRVPRTECRHGHGPEHWRVAKSGKSAWCVKCDQAARERATKKAKQTQVTTA